MKHIYTVAILAGLLTACGTNRGIEGHISTTGERLSGEVTNLRQSGDVKLVVNDDANNHVTANCSGLVNNVSAGSKAGGTYKGRVECSDGRTGDVVLNGSRKGGYGTGALNGQSYKFTYGSY